MEKTISCMKQPKKEVLFGDDVFEESFGIKKGEMIRDKKISENDLIIHHDIKKCFYCNKPLRITQKKFWPFKRKAYCMECTYEAVTTEEEASSIIDSCWYVLKYVYGLELNDRIYIKMKKFKFKKVISIKSKGKRKHTDGEIKENEEKIRKNEERVRKNEEKIKQNEEIIKRNKEIIKKNEEKIKESEERIKQNREMIKENKEILKKNKEIIKENKEKVKVNKRKKEKYPKLIFKVKKGIPRLRLIIEIFEWYIKKNYKYSESVVYQIIINSLSAMGELSYVYRYCMYYSENREGDSMQEHPLRVQRQPLEEFASPSTN